MAAKLKQIGLKQLKCDFNYQNITKEVIERQRHDNSEHKVMIKILDKLSERDENQNIIGLSSANDVIKEIESDSSLDVSQDVVNQVSKNERLIRNLVDIVSENNATKKQYKVTEINLTGDILANEVELNLVNSQLLPTDVDYNLFVQSVDKVSEHMREKAKEWNGKEVPSLSTSDLVILRDSKDLWKLKTEDLIEQLNESVVDRGFLIIVAKYRLTEVEEAINSLINTNISNSDLQNRLQSLVKILSDSGLQLIANKSDSISTMAMMFRKVTEKNRIPTNDDVIEIKAERDEKWFEAIKQCLEKSKDSLDAGEKPNNVWLIANDTNINGIVGLVNCLRIEPGGECFRCLFEMDSNKKLPIDWSSKPFSDILANDLVTNIIKNGKLGTYRHLKLPKDYDKTLSREYFLNQGANKDLSSLSWFDLTKLIPNQHDWSGNPIKLVPVNVYTSGLIFKDVMFATGLYRGYNKPIFHILVIIIGRIPSGIMSLYTDCFIGLEFAGRRVDTGERVMGFVESRAFATNVYPCRDLLTTIPDHWSMSDAGDDIEYLLHSMVWTHQKKEDFREV